MSTTNQTRACLKCKAPMDPQKTMGDREKWRCPKCHAVFYFDAEDTEPRVSVTLANHMAFSQGKFL